MAEIAEVRLGLDDKWYDAEHGLLGRKPTIEEVANAYPGSAESHRLLHSKLDRILELLNANPDCS